MEKGWGGEKEEKISSQFFENTLKIKKLNKTRSKKKI